MSNRADFYDAIRPLFGGRLNAKQVEGMEATLDATVGMPISWRAYMLATAFHETAQTMQPIEENLNYSVEGLLSTFGRHRITEAEARLYGRAPGRPANKRGIANAIYGGEWGRKNLGNTQPNDGFDMRGRGLPMITGRGNYEKFGIADNPDKALRMDVAVAIMVEGMTFGVFTGKRLADYLPGNYAGARQIINPDKLGAQIAGYAEKFEAALSLIDDDITTPSLVCSCGNIISKLADFLRSKK